MVDTGEILDSSGPMHHAPTICASHGGGISVAHSGTKSGGGQQAGSTPSGEKARQKPDISKEADFL
jgi:hypothetical protein